MNDFLRYLEASVRTHNILQGLGISTPEAFMALDKDTFMGVKGAGRRSWNEVVELQRMMSKTTRRETTRDRVFEMLKFTQPTLIKLLNELQRARAIAEEEGRLEEFNAFYCELMLCNSVSTDPIPSPEKALTEMLRVRD